MQKLVGPDEDAGVYLFESGGKLDLLGIADCYFGYFEEASALVLQGGPLIGLGILAAIVVSLDDLTVDALQQ